MSKIISYAGTDREGLILMTLDFKDHFSIPDVDKPDPWIICSNHCDVHVQEFYTCDLSSLCKLPSSVPAADNLHER